MRGWLPSLVSPNSFLDNPLELYSDSSSGWRKLLSPSITFPFLKLTKGCTLHTSSICVREASCTATPCDRQFLSDPGSVTEMGDHRGMPVRPLTTFMLLSRTQGPQEECGCKHTCDDTLSSYHPCSTHTSVPYSSHLGQRLLSPAAKAQPTAGKFYGLCLHSASLTPQHVTEQNKEKGIPGHNEAVDRVQSNSVDKSH